MSFLEFTALVKGPGQMTVPLWNRCERAYDRAQVDAGLEAELSDIPIPEEAK